MKRSKYGNDVGLIRFILIFFLSYVVYRVVILPFFQTPKKIKAPEIPTHDKMLPCPNCGTYNPSQMAVVSGGQYFCNDICVKSSKK